GAEGVAVHRQRRCAAELAEGLGLRGAGADEERARHPCCEGVAFHIRPPCPRERKGERPCSTRSADSQIPGAEVKWDPTRGVSGLLPTVGPRGPATRAGLAPLSGPSAAAYLPLIVTPSPDPADPPMPNLIDVLLLFALPAAGKSEVRRYLASLNPQQRRDELHLGPTVQLDDYPYVHMMRRVSQELRKRGADGIFFA